MNKINFLLCIFLIFSFSGALYSGEIVDRIVAVVEDEIILQSEVEMLAQTYAIQLKIDPRVDPEKYDNLRRQVLEQLIDQYVLLAKAIEDSVQITDEEVDMVLDQQIKDFIQQFGSQEEMEKKFGMPIRKLKTIYREDVRKKGLVDKLRQKMIGEVKITGEELEKFYDTMKDSLPEVPDGYDISQIVKITDPGDVSKKRALEKAQMILEKIKNGADFFEIVKLYSDDEATKENGGLIGYIKKGTFDASIRSFEIAAFSLKPGEVSDVVETPLGFHIIKVLDKKEDVINVQHILIKITRTEDDNAKIANFLKELKNRIESGESFESVAKENSEDPDAKRDGGKIGWIYIENIQPELEQFKQILPYLKIGEISEPFKTNIGYHIVKLENKTEKHKMTLETDRETVERIAKMRKSNEEFNKFVERARKEVYIEIKDQL